jgi:hypothetical protein
MADVTCLPGQTKTYSQCGFPPEPGCKAGVVCLNPKPVGGKCPDGYTVGPVPGAGRSIVLGCKPTATTQNVGPTVLEPQSLPTEAVPPPVAAPEIPFYKTVWFWGIIGLSAVGGLVYMRVRRPRQPTVTLGDATFNISCPGKQPEKRTFDATTDGMRYLSKLGVIKRCKVTIED